MVVDDEIYSRNLLGTTTSRFGRLASTSSGGGLEDLPTSWRFRPGFGDSLLPSCSKGAEIDKVIENLLKNMTAYLSNLRRSE